MKKAIVGMIFVVLVIGAATQAEKLQIDGSTTVGTIANAFAECFKVLYPGLDITVKKTGSGDGAAARVSERAAFFCVGELIEYDRTSKIFSNPANEQTEDYVTGRFG